MELSRTPLFAEHVALGGKMVPFAGYEMPVQYRGVLAEAKAVREAVGVFDVSHMGRFHVSGPSARADLSRLLTNDLGKLTDGIGQYTLLTNDDGGTIDDLIVYREAETVYSLVVNASNREKDRARIEGGLTDSVLRDLTDGTVLLAVQGPKAADLLAELAPHASQVTETPVFGLLATRLGPIEVGLMRSGYTGEDGFEVVARASEGPALWRLLIDAGATPCGLAARDALRVEAGLPLYGHELEENLSPIAAGLGWAIRKTGGYPGETAIERDRTDGTARRLVGVRLDAKRLIPIGAAVHAEGRIVGSVTSGVVSPLLDAALALAFVDREVPLDTPCSVDLRGRLEPGRIVGKRFIPKR